MVIHWFRRDLRLEDNCPLFHALRSGHEVLPIFIFDTHILEGLPTDDARVSYIHQTLEKVDAQLQELGSGLQMYYGSPLEVFQALTQKYDIRAVYCGEDYEPQAMARDTDVSQYLASCGVAFRTYKEHVLFHKDEILKQDGTPYRVFTPYFKQWLPRAKQSVKPYPSEAHANYVSIKSKLLSLTDIGFERSTLPMPRVYLDSIAKYSDTRDFPSLHTSQLGLALRFGTVSIRTLFLDSVEQNQTFVSELAWREFFAQIMYHFPQVVHNAFKPKYDRIQWINDATHFERWKEGKTGYPIVDAGMRELNATGYMHNRVRMITASFLIKHLLIDWRWGEAYFAEKLLDFDLASNNGNWQWVTGSGCDAAPYFRVFNPESQQKKFDPDFVYIKRWVLEFSDWSYPQPIVEHKFARERVLQAFKHALD